MRRLTPTKLRLVLVGSIALLLVVSILGFWFFRSQLFAYAALVNKDAQDANTSSNDITILQRLEKQLEDDKVAVNRAKNIVADSKSYQYQNQIINDLNAYAKASGVSIASYSFTSDAAAAGASSSTAAGAQPTQAATTPTGLKSTSVTVSISNPVNYQAIMRFIHSIELNLTKMQLTGVSLAQSETSKDNVTITPLTLEVYIR